jgi:hypothetical protein
MDFCIFCIFKPREVENVIKNMPKWRILNEEERADFFMQYFNDSDADEEFEGFDEFDIAENIEIVGGRAPDKLRICVFYVHVLAHFQRTTCSQIYFRFSSYLLRKPHLFVILTAIG